MKYFLKNLKLSLKFENCFSHVKGSFHRSKIHSLHSSLSYRIFHSNSSLQLQIGRKSSMLIPQKTLIDLYMKFHSSKKPKTNLSTSSRPKLTQLKQFCTLMFFDLFLCSYLFGFQYSDYRYQLIQFFLIPIELFYKR